MGMRGLSGIEDTLLLSMLDTTEEVSDGQGSQIPLSTAPHTLPDPLPSCVVPVLVLVLPLLKIPVRGLERFAGLCLSRLRRRAGDACTRNVSKSAC